MGNYASKLLSYNDESRKENNKPQEDAQQKATQDSEIHTPIMSNRRVVIDPRSATAEILRTPIEIDNTPGSKENKKAPNAIPKYLQRKRYLETDMDVVMPPLTPRKHFMAKSTDNIHLSEMNETRNYLTPNINTSMDVNEMTLIEKERYKILGLDPRSPATDFDRTPILLPRSLALLKARSQENLSRKGSYETDVYDPTQSYQEVGNSIPEIQIVPDIASEGLKTLNLKIQNELHISDTTLSDSDSSIFVNEEEVTVIKKSESNKNELTSNELIFHNNKIEGEQDDYKDIEQATKVMHTKVDDTIKIWHDTLSKEDALGKTKKRESIEKKLSRQGILTEKITFDECDIKNISLSRATKTEENVLIKEDVAEKKKTATADAKPNEKKIFSPDNRHSNEIIKNRTPLSNRSNNGRIQGMPTKSPQHLLINKATKTQQENTPPQRHIAKTRNGTQWDSNSTVVI